jgi:hypothetical protein
VSGEMLDASPRAVILERIDGAHLARSREFIHHPSVKAVAKGYVLRPWTLNNAAPGRFHAHLLADGGVTAEGESMALPGPATPLVTEKDSQKIVTGHGFGAYANLDSFVRTEVDFDANRECDVMFCGTIKYAGSEIERHRKLALQCAQDWDRKYPGRAISGGGRPLRKGEYVRAMLRSKAALSPWGWGEPCHRDYEAMCLGCVLIKPAMDHVTCWPGIYRPGETFVPCHLDFSDAPEHIERISSDWPSYREMRTRARRMVAEASPRDAIAARYAAILEGAA